MAGRSVSTERQERKTERDCYSGYCVIEFLHDAKLDAILEDAQ